MRLNELKSESELREFLVDEVTELSGAERVLLLLETPGGVAIGGAELPSGEDPATALAGIGPWIDEARRTRAVSLRHVPGRKPPIDQRSSIVAPLIAQRELLGYVYCDIDGAFGRFREGDRDLLAMLAAQAAVALANLRTQEGLERTVAERTAELEQRAGELAIINGIQQAMAAELDFQAIVDLVGDKLREVFATGDIGIWWWDAEKRTGHGLYVFEHGVRHHHAPYVMPPGDPLERVLDRRETLHVNNRAESAAIGLNAIEGTDQSLSALIMPIIGGDRVLGSVVLEDYERENAFGPDAVRLLGTVVASMGTALENVRLFDETKEALERQTATAEILKVIAASPADEQPVFDAIVASAARLFGRKAALRTLDDDGLRRRARSYAPEQGEFHGPEVEPLGRASIVGRAVLDGRPLQWTDTLVDGAASHGLERARSLAFRSIASAPLMSGGRAIGVVSVSSPEPGAMSEQQMALLATFADQAVIAIQNARLFNETREALERQTATAEVLQVISGSMADAQPVFERILDSCERLFGTQEMGICLARDGMIGFPAYRGRFADMVKAEYPRPLAGSVSERVMASGEVQHIPDASADDMPAYVSRLVADYANFSLASAPMLWQGQGIGTIDIARSPPRPFSDKELALLRTFAGQAVVAIQNAKLFNETQEALRRQTASADILRVISASPSSVEPVFDAIVNAAVPLLSCSFVIVLRRDGETFSPVAGANLSGAMQDLGPTSLPIDPAQNFPSRAILAKAMLHLPDWDAIDLPPHETHIRRALNVRSALYLPLMREDECIGLLAFGRSEPHAFAPHEIALAGSFRDQAVIAIENVRLFNETREALAHQTASADILRVISSTRSDVQPVFDAIVTTAVKHLGCDIAIVQICSGGTYSPKAMATPAGLTPVPGSTVIPVDPDANFPSRAIVSKTMLHLRDWSAIQLPPHEQARHEQLGLNSTLYLPLLRGDACVGVLVLGNKRANGFNEKAIALAESFRDQAVIAIENVRLFNETREALEQQRASGEVLAAISNSIADAAPVFDTILVSCERLFAGKVGVIDVLGADGLVHLGAYHGERQGSVQPVYPHSAGADSATGTVLAKRDVVQFGNLDEAPPAARRAFAAFGVEAAMGAPMLWEGRAIGAIWVTRDRPGAFMDKEVALLRTFADQAVVAIRNAKLFNETREALEQQTATAEVLKVISSSVADTAPVFDKILDSCQRLFGTEHLGIVVVRDDGMIDAAAQRGSIVQSDDAHPAHAGGVEPHRHRDPRAPHRADRRRGSVRTGQRVGARDLRAGRQLLCCLGADALGGPRHRLADDRAPAAGAVQREGTGAVAHVRRPGGDRDPERAPVQRDQGSAGAADGDRRDPPRDQRVADRRAAGAGSGGAARGSTVPGGRQPRVAAREWPAARHDELRPGLRGDDGLRDAAARADVDRRPLRARTPADPRRGRAAGDGRRVPGHSWHPAALRIPHGAERAAVARRRGGRRDLVAAQGGAAVRIRRDRPAADVRRPGRDRHRERALVPRDQRGAGEPDRERRDPARDEPLADRRAAGVRGDRRQRGEAPRVRLRLRHAPRRQHLLGGRGSHAGRAAGGPAFGPAGRPGAELPVAGDRREADAPPPGLVRDRAARLRARGERAVRHPGGAVPADAARRRVRRPAQLRQ